MQILVSLPDDEGADVAQRLAAALPDAQVDDAAAAASLAPADYVVVGHADGRLFETQRTMKAIFTWSAGVGHVLAQANLPPQVPLIRLEDAGMAAQMVRYVRAAALRFAQRLDVYGRQQRARTWKRFAPRAPDSLVAGVLGLGVIGTQVAQALAAEGFRTRGFARTKKAVDGVACFAGDDALPAFLTGVDLLVDVLPLTAASTGIIDRNALALLADGAHVINIGRGATLVEADLLARIDDGKLSGATLDVFEDEPLPIDHPFWTRPEIAVTPHMSGVTLPDDAVAQIAAKIQRIERGLPVSGAVDRTRGY